MLAAFLRPVRRCCSRHTARLSTAPLDDLLRELEADQRGQKKRAKSFQSSNEAMLKVPGQPRRRQRAPSHRQSQVAAELRKALMEALLHDDSELADLAAFLEVTEVSWLKTAIGFVCF